MPMELSERHRRKRAEYRRLVDEFMARIRRDREHPMNRA
jgi:hypothetical protein